MLQLKKSNFFHKIKYEDFKYVFEISTKLDRYFFECSTFYSKRICRLVDSFKDKNQEISFVSLGKDKQKESIQ
jgi:hypothetical protein